MVNGAARRLSFFPYTRFFKVFFGFRTSSAALKGWLSQITAFCPLLVEVGWNSAVVGICYSGRRRSFPTVWVSTDARWRRKGTWTHPATAVHPSLLQAALTTKYSETDFDPFRNGHSQHLSRSIQTGSEWQSVTVGLSKRSAQSLDPASYHFSARTKPKVSSTRIPSETEWILGWGRIIGSLGSFRFAIRWSV